MSETNFYVVMATDKPDMAQLRHAIRPAHRTYLNNQSQVRIHAAGPLVDESGATMTGTFVLCAADSLASVETFIAQDPYAKAALFGEIAVRRLNWTLGDPLRAEADSTSASAATHSVR